MNTFIATLVVIIFLGLLAGSIYGWIKYRD